MIFFSAGFFSRQGHPAGEKAEKSAAGSSRLSQAGGKGPGSSVISRVLTFPTSSGNWLAKESPPGTPPSDLFSHPGDAGENVRWDLGKDQLKGHHC